MEVTSGVAELQVDIDRRALARYGLNVSDVQEIIGTLVGGKPVSEMIQGRARFPISIMLPENLRNDPDKLRDLSIRAPGGELIRWAVLIMKLPEKQAPHRAQDKRFLFPSD